MRHLVWQEPGLLEWQTADDPVPGPGEAVVRPLAVARCDLDPIMAATGIFPGPFPVGHELAAEILEVGEGVARHMPGDLVIAPFQISCGACAACYDRRYAGCHTHRAPAGAAFGFGPAGGGFGGAVADQLLIPAADHMLHRAPEGLGPTVLCLLADNVLDAYRAVGPPLCRTPGADVLVVGGTGPSIGLYAVGWAAALGAGTVSYVDEDPARLEIAERLGAQAIEHHGEWPKRYGRAAITVANSGDQEGLACAIRSTDDYGVCTPTAIHFEPTTPVPLLAMYTKGITLEMGRADSRRHLPAVLRLVASGQFDPLRVAATLVPIEDAAEAWLAPATKLIFTASSVTH